MNEKVSQIIPCPVCKRPFEYDDEDFYSEPHCGRPTCSAIYQQFLDAQMDALVK